MPVNFLWKEKTELCPICFCSYVPFTYFCPVAAVAQDGSYPALRMALKKYQRLVQASARGRILKMEIVAMHDSLIDIIYFLWWM
jgi:hypothetical protein